MFPLGEEWCGVYLHIPFCRSKCDYCDFLSFPNVPRSEMESYVERLVCEMEDRIPRAMEGFSRFTLYLGGGTPTVLPHDLLKRILEKSCCLLPELEEITVETNPFAVDGDLVSLFEDYGVSRVSLGIQSLSQKILKALGRRATVKEGLKALEVLADRRFTLSVDLIYGAPRQRCEDLLHDLEILMDFGPAHISAYSLTLEDNTPLRRAVEAGRVTMPSEEQWAEQFETVRGFLQDRGYTHYEISNFAKDGSYCLHNLIYWSNGSYLGLGVGAVSHIGDRRWGNTDTLGEYLKGDFSPQWEERLPTLQKAAETAILMLRTRWGVPASHPVTCHREVRERLEHLSRQGLLAFNGHSWVIPSPLLPVANEVMVQLIPD